MSDNTENNAILNLVQKMTDAFHKGDIEGVMSTYADGAVVMFEPGAPVLGKANIRERFVQAFAIQPKFTYSGHEVIVSGQTATHFAPWTMVGTAPDGSEIRGEGLSVAVMEKQQDGRWLMTIDNPYGSHLVG